MSKPTEHCVSAAMQMSDGEVIKGERHHNCIQTSVGLGYTRADVANAVQGFITSDGRFLGRVEARQLQDAAGIQSASEGGYRGSGLFSEDLY